MLQRISLLVFLIMSCLALGACGGKKPGQYPATAPDSAICADLATLPQNLEPYAELAGRNKVLLSAEDQAEHMTRLKRRVFYPWQVTKPNNYLKKSLDADFYMKREKGFGENLRPYTEEAWNELVENSRKGEYPTRAETAITVRNTNLRAMPTEKPYFLDPDKYGEGYPFDYFQHTALWVGTPVFISHVSKDAEWVLAETFFAAGWIPAEDVAVVGEKFKEQWQNRPLAALLRDNVLLWDRGQRDKTTGKPLSIHGHIGTLLPLAHGSGKLPDHGRNESLEVFFPKRAADGSAVIGTARLTKGEAGVAPLPLTPGEIARVGNEMMGQPYGWGGLFENRDCSALTRDIYMPFGIWLPRNSASQGGWGTPVDLKELEPDAKEAKILAEAVPFFSLLWLRGHICLYLGEWKGKPVMYHNIWGLRVRTVGPGNIICEGRAVIGKACVTTLRPGAELADITSPASLLDRIERVSILPEAEEKEPVIKSQSKSKNNKRQSARSSSRSRR